MAAKVLYKVMNGGVPSAKEVKATFDKSTRLNKPIEGVFKQSYLYRYECTGYGNFDGSTWTY